MKKFSVLAAVIACLFVFAGVLYADSDPFFHVRLHGAIKASGSSKNVKISDEGLDVKESVRQLLIQRKDDEVLSLLYPKFDDKAWANMKFRSLLPAENKVFWGVLVGGETIYIIPDGKLSAKPVPKNTVPSAKTGLLNPRNPLKIMTFTNKLSFDFQWENDTYPMRFLDSKGRELGSLKANWHNAKGDEKLEVTLPDKAADYYIELTDYEGRATEGTVNGSPSKYCYVLVNIEPDPVKPAEDPKVTANIEKFEASMKQAEQKMQNYMDRHGITDREQLTEDDMFTMMKEEQSSATDKAHKQALSSIEIMQNYMKEHNISRSQNLTEKDMEAIKKLVIKNSVESSPAEFRAAVDKYMKQHKISGYENLTEKDIQTISRQFERQTPKSRKKTR